MIDEQNAKDERERFEKTLALFNVWLAKRLGSGEAEIVSVPDPPWVRRDSAGLVILPERLDPHPRAEDGIDGTAPRSCMAVAAVSAVQRERALSEVRL